MAPPTAGDGGGDDVQLFAGVCFVLVGFDSVSEAQYRSEMVRRGGADAGRYEAGCTHVVVCGRVYDDPMCLAARKDGKVLVTELWVDDSLDLGALADSGRIIYRPVRDLNGIPGSESLHICLTGYQRNGREDIMKMVSLMGARFSKPLIANQVTHLICYKFEGEKYELAKKVNIKLVNHRWLEDCLKAWEILPVDNYTKSGWELEILEAEARDSEDEAEDVGRRSFDVRTSVRSTPSIKSGMKISTDTGILAPIRTPVPTSGSGVVVSGRHLSNADQILENEAEEVGRRALDNKANLRSTPNANNGMAFSPDVIAPIRTPTTPRGNRETVAGRHVNNSEHIIVTNNLFSTPSRENMSTKAPSPSNTGNKVEDQREDGAAANRTATADCSRAEDKLILREANLKSVGTAMLEKIRSLSYSRKHPQKSVSPEEVLVHPMVSPQRTEGTTLGVDFNVSPMDNRGEQKVSDFVDVQSLKDSEMVKHVDGSGSTPAQKKKSFISSVSTALQNGLLGSTNGISKGCSMMKDSAGSEGATISSLEKKFIESTKVDSCVEGDAAVNLLQKQQPGSSKSKVSIHRKTSLKRARPVESVELGEPSANDKNLSSPEKAKKLHNRMTENTANSKYAESPATTTRDAKRDSAFSLLNKELQETGAQLSVENAVSHVILSPIHGRTGKAVMKDNAGSEEAITSSLEKNFIGSTKVDSCVEGDAAVNILQKQKLSLSKSRVSVYRKSSLKRPRPVEGVKLDEHLSNNKNIVSPEKAKILDEAMTENTANLKCAQNPASTTADAKRNSGFPLHNKDLGKADALLSVENAVSHVSMSPIHGRNRKALMKDKTPQSFLSSSKNSKVDSRSGDTNVEMTDKSILGKTETIASKSELENFVSDENSGLEPKKLSSSASAVEHKTSCPKEPTTTRVRNRVAKRSQSADIEMTDVPVANKNEKVASGSEFDRVVSQENAETGTKKFSSSACAAADEHQRISPKETRATRLRNVVAKGPLNVDNEMTDSPVVNKTEAVASKSQFDWEFPSEHGETEPKNLSSTASPDDHETTKKETTKRVRNAVAKRKMKVGQQNVGRKSGKNGSVSDTVKAASSKRTEEDSRHVDKVRADQEPQKPSGVKEAGGSFCKDVFMVTKPEVLQKSKSRGSKRSTKGIRNENRPDYGSVGSKSKGIRNENMVSTGGTKSVQNGENVLDEHSSMIKQNGSGSIARLEPAWFILSGHRLQRRDYRSILRRLKGRVCRDSHHWSFQATHFICPDPLRRTEKFFAAAASGRWILKTDYLTACNEAGKLLGEEPYEWFGSGLNDSDTISLEAPRKWRLVRERTGHGAFYGMRIVVYGESISPSLDTLKRAVRAGDGTILATAPPYTRFLKTGVDFAVVSACMLSADAWVQEFGRHGIPCVSADYLVEYVCKPGFPLNKHVLFKTHDLADKSLEKLVKNQQEVVFDPAAEPSEDGDVDLSCSVCGSNDREEVMLICGDEDGAAGCGVGTHIDCCDPPLEAVPDCDWLCPRCDSRAPKAKGCKSRASKRR